MNANAVADQASTFTHLSPQAGGSLSLQEQLSGPSFHSFTSKTTPSLSFTRVVLNVWFTLWRAFHGGGTFGGHSGTPSHDWSHLASPTRPGSSTAIRRASSLRARPNWISVA